MGNSAESVAQISEHYPELTIVDQRPAWMTDQNFEKFQKSNNYDIEDTVVGLLAEIIDAPASSRRLGSQQLLAVS